jgi:hypothetical protein
MAMTMKVIPVMSSNSNTVLKIPELVFLSRKKNKIIVMITEITAMINSCFSILVPLDSPGVRVIIANN